MLSFSNVFFCLFKLHERSSIWFHYDGKKENISRRGSSSLITCIVDGVPHLVAVDAPWLVGVIVLKDSLKKIAQISLMFVLC